MTKFIEDFNKKVEELTNAVDKAAEEEDYDQAEQLQEELETYQNTNQPLVDAYNKKLSQPEEEEQQEVAPVT